MTGSRRHRIERVAQIGATARRMADAIRAGGLVRVSCELADALDVMLQTADSVANMAHSELLLLEESRDWEGE